MRVRPNISKLQIIQATTMLSVTSLTTMSLGTQTPIRDTFGQYGCHFYWTSSKAYDWGMGTSGSGMAIYRLICFHYLFKRNLNQKAMTKYILIAECTLSFLSISCNAACFNMFGWEKAIFYQFCMNYGAEKVDVIHQYESKDFDVSLYWILRFGPNIVAQVMIIVELGIYVWIIWHLKRHDDDNVKMKIITEHMRQERHQKNVITLKGQAAGFIVEMAYVTYVAIHSTNFSLVDPSIMPISQIIAATTISVAQLLASHEMKRFLKNKFNL